MLKEILQFVGIILLFILFIAAMFDNGLHNDDASKKFRADQDEKLKMQLLEEKYKALENNQTW